MESLSYAVCAITHCPTGSCCFLFIQAYVRVYVRCRLAPIAVLYSTGYTGRFQSRLEPIRLHPFNSAAAAAAIMPLLLLTVYLFSLHFCVNEILQSSRLNIYKMYAIFSTGFDDKIFVCFNRIVYCAQE
jgi:hypothetical protein